MDFITSEIRKMDYDDLLYEFFDLAAQVRELPTDHISVQNTLEGIAGYYFYLEQNLILTDSDFLDAAFNDLIECVNNYAEPWYKPVTYNYATFYYSTINDEEA